MDLDTLRMSIMDSIISFHEDKFVLKEFSVCRVECREDPALYDHCQVENTSTNYASEKMSKQA
jgi:hypothetical protein